MQPHVEVIAIIRSESLKSSFHIISLYVMRFEWRVPLPSFAQMLQLCLLHMKQKLTDT